MSEHKNDDKNDTKQTKVSAEGTHDDIGEGTSADRTKFGHGGNRMPLFLALIWGVFFVWMVAYLAMYMVPALP